MVDEEEEEEEEETEEEEEEEEEEDAEEVEEEEEEEEEPVLRFLSSPFLGLLLLVPKVRLATTIKGVYPLISIRLIASLTALFIETTSPIGCIGLESGFNGDAEGVSEGVALEFALVAILRMLVSTPKASPSATIL